MGVRRGSRFRLTALSSYTGATLIPKTSADEPGMIPNVWRLSTVLNVVWSKLQYVVLEYMYYSIAQTRDGRGLMV